RRLTSVEAACPDRARSESVPPIGDRCAVARVRPAISHTGREDRFPHMNPTPSARSRMRSSVLGGVPTTLPSPGAFRLGQLALTLPGSTVGERTSHPLPDVTHISGWLTPEEQQSLARQFREWAEPPAGLRHPRVPTGGLMTVQSVCLGWHWQPYVYSR